MTAGEPTPDELTELRYCYHELARREQADRARGDNPWRWQLNRRVARFVIEQEMIRQGRPMSQGLEPLSEAENQALNAKAGGLGVKHPLLQDPGTRQASDPQPVPAAMDRPGIAARVKALMRIVRQDDEASNPPDDSSA